MDVSDIDDDLLETGTIPAPTWVKANRSTVWLWVGTGVAGTLGVEVIVATIIAVVMLR